MSSQRGSSAVEAAVVIPVVLLIIFLAVAGIRIGWTRAQVVDAAAASARAATIPASASLAQEWAHLVVAEDLATLDVSCRSLSVQVETTSQGGSDEVTVRVSCAVDLADLVLPGLPGQIVVEGTSVEVVDRLRVREP